jgi:hypothetical protein
MKIREMLGVMAITVMLLAIGFTAGRLETNAFTMDYTLPIKETTKRING